MSSIDKKFVFFPEDRINSDYPWQVWIIGWLIFLKALVWFSTSPNVNDEVLTVLGIKYLLFMVPFVACGFGLWNFKKWALFGVIALCCLEILFFIFYPVSVTSLGFDHMSFISLVFSVCVFLINGPLSTICVLLFAPSLFKIIKEKNE